MREGGPVGPPKCTFQVEEVVACSRMPPPPNIPFYCPLNCKGGLLSTEEMPLIFDKMGLSSTFAWNGPGPNKNDIMECGLISRRCETETGQSNKSGWVDEKEKVGRGDRLCSPFLPKNVRTGNTNVVLKGTSL